MVKTRGKQASQRSPPNREEPTMSTQEQARALMMRHHHAVKNRQQSMLSRSAAEVGLEPDDYWTNIQGKLQSSFRVSYDRSHATMS